jgi:cellobiose phosphorylase
LTRRGNNDVGGNFNDDPAWLILGVAAYLKESGDWSILDESVPYDNKVELATPLWYSAISIRSITPPTACVDRRHWNDA